MFSCRKLFHTVSNKLLFVAYPISDLYLGKFRIHNSIHGIVYLSLSGIGLHINWCFGYPNFGINKFG